VALLANQLIDGLHRFPVSLTPSRFRPTSVYWRKANARTWRQERSPARGKSFAAEWPDL
jgi:hypothetical protein